MPRGPRKSHEEKLDEKIAVVQAKIDKKKGEIEKLQEELDALQDEKETKSLDEIRQLVSESGVSAIAAFDFLKQNIDALKQSAGANLESEEAPEAEDHE